MPYTTLKKKPNNICSPLCVYANRSEVSHRCMENVSASSHPAEKIYKFFSSTTENLMSKTDEQFSVAESDNIDTVSQLKM